MSNATIAAIVLALAFDGLAVFMFWVDHYRPAKGPVLTITNKTDLPVMVGDVMLAPPHTTSTINLSERR